MALEIELHSAPSAEHARGVQRCMERLGLSRGYVVHAGRDDYSLGGGVRAIAAASLLAIPRDIARL